MDRLARNLDDLRRLVQKLTKRGVRIEFLKEGLVLTGEDSPMANLMLSVMGAFAEFERALVNDIVRVSPWLSNVVLTAVAKKRCPLNKPLQSNNAPLPVNQKLCWLASSVSVGKLSTNIYARMSDTCPVVQFFRAVSGTSACTA
jgi:hypothetical protein